MADSDYIQGIDSSQNTNDAEFIQGTQTSPNKYGPYAPADNSAISYTHVAHPNSLFGSYGYGIQEGVSGLTEGIIQRVAQAGNKLGLVSDQREQQIENNINAIREKQNAVYNNYFDQNSSGQSIARAAGNISGQTAMTAPLMTLGATTLARTLAQSAIYGALNPTTESGESLAKNELLNIGIGGLLHNSASLMNIAGATINKTGLPLKTAKTLITPTLGAAIGYNMAPNDASLPTKLSAAATGALGGAYLGTKIFKGNNLLEAWGNRKYLNAMQEIDPAKQLAFTEQGITTASPGALAPYASTLAQEEKRLGMSPELRQQAAQNHVNNVSQAIGNLKNITDDLRPWASSDERDAAFDALKTVPIATHPIQMNTNDGGIISPFPLANGDSVPAYIDPNNDWQMRQLENFRKNVDPTIIPPNSAYEAQQLKSELDNTNSEIITGNAKSKSDLADTIRAYAYQNVDGYKDLMNKSQSDILGSRWGDQLGQLNIKPGQKVPGAKEVFDTFFGTRDTANQFYEDLTRAGASPEQLEDARQLEQVFDGLAQSKGEQIANRLGSDASNVSAHGPVAAMGDFIRRKTIANVANGYWRMVLDPRYRQQVKSIIAAKGLEQQKARLYPLLTQIILNGANQPANLPNQ